MRSLRRLAALCAVAMMATSCSDVPTGADPTVTALGRIGLAPAFTPTAVTAYQQLVQFGIEVTSVHVRLVAPDGSTRDTSIAFPPGMSELEIELAVPLRTAGQTFRADLELLNSDGVVLFSGTQQVVAQAANGIGSSAPATVQINYTGPGASAKTVTVTPAAGVIAGAGSLPLAAAAADAGGAALSNLLVRWTTSDATLATVTTTGNAAATVTSTGKRGVVTISAITPLGLTGTALLTVVPVASKIVVISGGSQTGVAGSLVAQPLVVEVQAADNLPVPNAAVNFRAVTAGGVVTTASATTDASGRSSTTLTLGQGAGVYLFEATSGTLTPAGISVTATAAPAASISIVSGNFQSGIIGTALPQPLVVKVVNKFGAPVGGATVNWATTVGNGSPSSASSTTASDGTASTTFVLGTRAQIEALRAFLPGVVPPSTGEVFFSMASTPEAPDEITGTGGGQHAVAGTALASPLVVKVVDQYGNPVSGLKVAWAVSAGPATATLTPASSTLDANGNASTTVTLGNIAGPLTITATVANLTLNFSATADPGATSGPGILSGRVVDAVSRAELSGATVAVLSGTQTVATVTTNSNGIFSTAVLPAGSYSATVTLTGYTTVTITTMTVNGNSQAPEAPLVPQSTQPGGIAGIVRDATNNQLITGTVTLELRAGVNSTTGTPLQTATTNQGAAYSFTNVAAGTYTLVAKATGYVDATITGISVGGSTTSNQNLVLSPVGVAGNVRIVLTWGARPLDLDSYLTGPLASGGRFLVYYGSRGNCAASPFACLDVDVQNGRGPETITITRQLPGPYRYSVNNYSQSPNMDVSGARVDVYIDNALAQSFSVPSGNGLDWVVFELNGTVITPINTIGNGQQDARIPTGGGISASRIPTTGAAARAREDDAKIKEARRTHPKRTPSPR